MRRSPTLRLIISDYLYQTFYNNDVGFHFILPNIIIVAESPLRFDAIAKDF
ncbi:hypothetical protein OSCI_4110035 [Kamptonema sp. PCC 6506]|nr:hypothetical protein OSCI_4110035 [Kamptonema sp. PCC 6506]